MRKFVVTIVLSVAALTGCTEARVALPINTVASTERIELTGMGGWQNGRFRIGASEGQFSRRADKMAVATAFVRSSGGASFKVVGPEFNGTAEGRCWFDEREVDLGLIVVPSSRLTYACEFGRAGRPNGSLFLTELPNGRGLLAGRTRAGEYRSGDRKLIIRAIHRSEGSRVRTGRPLGYGFEITGRQVGAVDLNGIDKTIYAPRQSGWERDAVLMTSLALSVFWDPGE